MISFSSEELIPISCSLSSNWSDHLNLSLNKEVEEVHINDLNTNLTLLRGQMPFCGGGSFFASTLRFAITEHDNRDT